MPRCPQQWMNKEAFARVSGNQAGDGEVAGVRCIVLVCCGSGGCHIVVVMGLLSLLRLSWLWQLPCSCCDEEIFIGLGCH